MLIVLMVVINFLIKIIGEERVNNWVFKLGKNFFIRYILFLLVLVFFLGNFMCYIFGRFLKEEYKVGFYDVVVLFVYLIIGFFLYVNVGEFFVWLGIFVGLIILGKEIIILVLWYFIVGLIVIFIRGIVIEKMYVFLIRKNRVINKV